MKSTLIYLCLLFALVISCGTQDKKSLVEKIQGKKTDTVADSLKIRVLKEYYSNGKVKTETEAKGNLRHGLMKSYNREGLLLSQVNYVDNVKEGMATNFYPETGKINSTLNYKNGIKEGEEIWYWENGNPCRVTPYVKGVIEGIRKYYYEDGKLMAETPYKNGYPGTGLKEYKNDGTPITNQVKLVITQKDYLADANKVILNIELSDPNLKVDFYRGSLTDGKYLNDNLFQLAVQYGMTKIDFNVPPGGAINQKVVITAHFKKGSLAIPVVLSRTYNLSVVNNN
ncbi:MAG: toxin-antitoxin system YwqK family antitoxin [Bacteroidales bacterium]|nr:toxin-antitoxin system YwqK family antitoxin [Bacteroidales bacterium]